jgi:hydrogenase/urease accessory protein HupE
MAELVYALCAATSAGCAIALLRTYLQRGSRVLLWSSLCFIGLAANNAILFVDLVLLPRVDLSLARAWCAAGAILALVVGLIWDVE